MRFALAPVVVLLAAAAARPSDYSILAPVEPPRPDVLTATLKQVKARRAALDAIAGPHPAFDLTYLPRPAADIQALIGVRPSVVFAHPDLAPGVATLETAVAQVLGMFGGTSAGPGLAGVDQLLLCGNATIVPNPTPVDGRTAMFVVGATGFAARAAKPFDWDAAVRAWFPKSEVRTHRGASFRVLKLNLAGLFPGFPADGMEVGFYAAPDGRTLVADSAECLTALIDRLKDGRPATPPPGWDAVSTAAVAIAVDNRNKQWVWVQPADPGPVVMAGANRLFLAADQFAFGLDIGPVTRFRAAAFCRDPFQARHARQGRKEMMDRLSDRFAPARDEKPSLAWEDMAALTDALLKDGKATPTPLGFAYAAEAPGDLFGLITRAAEAGAPRPTAPPPGFPAPGPGSVGYVPPAPTLPTTPPPPGLGLPPAPPFHAGAPPTPPPAFTPITPLPTPPVVHEKPGWYPPGNGFPGTGAGRSGF